MSSYRDGGVDIDAGNELVRRIAPAARASQRPEVLSNLGGFAALAELPPGYEHPVLVTGTDGVGTKLKLAIDSDRHDRIGQDLVAMCVNDVLVVGAEPFLFLDYYATGRLDVDVAERVIKGIAEACTLAGCALVGGETAEMPGFYTKGEYDLAGFCVGIVEKEGIIDGSRIEVGDVLLGLASSGPHSNGYSLIRHVLDEAEPRNKGEWLDALMEPTRIYVDSILRLLENDSVAVRGMAHITGGGLLENVPRMFGKRPLAALLELQSWKRPPVFDFLKQTGQIEEREMLRTFNCGIGFVVCVSQRDAEEACRRLADSGEEVTIIGRIVGPDASAGPGQALVRDGSSELA